MEFNLSQTTMETPVESVLVPTLEELNNKRSLVLIPALIFVVLFMIVGFLGNGMVIYIYGWRMRNSNIHVLLLLLACIDMLCCLVGLPLQLVELRLNYIYPSRHLCKLSTFITFYCCNASILTLLAICALRYHKVCRFSKQQMSVSQARVLAVFVCLISLPLTIPAAVFFDVKEVPIDSGAVIHMCINRGSYVELWTFLTVMLIYNLTILISMFVLYGLIWVKARKHEDLLRRHPGESSKVKQRKPRTKNRTFVGITVLFAVGFIPGLLLGVLYPLYEHVILSNGLEALRNVVYRMWILNSTLNPVIYGFFGLRFRREVKDIFSRSLSWKRSESSTSETPQ